jgi:hypothetical protein
LHTHVLIPLGLACHCNTFLVFLLLPDTKPQTYCQQFAAIRHSLENIRHIITGSNSSTGKCYLLLHANLNLLQEDKQRPGWLSRYSDSLRAGRSGDRIPVEARFSPPVQTGPGAYPASYTMGTGSFPGVKRQGRGFDHPHPSSAKVKKRVGLYLYSPSGPS